MHLKRWLSGLIMAPALIWVVLYAPRPLFLAFILLLTFQGWREFQALLQAEQPFPQRTFTLILGLLLTASLYRGEGPHVLPILGMIFLLRFAFSLFPPHDFPLRLERLSRDLLGLFYISFLLGHFLLLHGLEEGPAWVLFTLAAVYSGDTAAFYVGLAWGKKKLAPRISPGKTVEGGLGAVGGSL
ncbi:MAG: phosphatidate cytidylyltransferase, partial [Deltaproteobacteria bacterium]|nr:phosphatidate cytidylyltransferase [Deltaproteobacteria bacterium]